MISCLRSAFIDMERGDLLEMAEKENKTIKEAKENYEVLTGDAELKRLAEIRLMSALEEQSALDTAREEGIVEGAKQNKKEIAKKLLEKGMEVEEIAEITGLSKEAIEKLK